MWKRCANDMQNHAQMKESKCAKDILKCANEKRWSTLGVGALLLCLEVVLEGVSSSLPFHFFNSNLFHMLDKRYNFILTLFLLVAPADNFCKQLGPRSGPTKCRALSWSKLFDTLMVFLKESFEKVDFEKNQQTTKKHEKLPRGQKVNRIHTGMATLHCM